jgi:hypothetical protein
VLCDGCSQSCRSHWQPDGQLYESISRVAREVRCGTAALNAGSEPSVWPALCPGTTDIMRSTFVWYTRVSQRSRGMSDLSLDRRTQ